MDEQKTKAAFASLAGAKPHRKVVDKNPFKFTNPAVMKLLNRGEPSLIDSVEELVWMISDVRASFASQKPTEVDKDALWLAATAAAAKKAGVAEHSFLRTPGIRAVFNDIVVDVLSGPVYASPQDA